MTIRTVRSEKITLGINKCACRQQRGLTLIELSIVMIVIGILIYVGINFSQQIGDISRRQQMLLQEKAWEDVLDGIQRSYMVDLATAAGVITSPDGGTNLILHPDSVGACGTAANVSVVNTLLNNFVGEAEAQGLNRNPWARPWCLRVGGVQVVQLSGLELSVRPLAVLSDGLQQNFQTSSAATIGIVCPISAVGDSKHICSSGVATAAKALEITNEKMEIIAEKLQAYSRSQAILNPQGGFIDYFLNDAAVAPANQADDCGTPLTNPPYSFHDASPLAPTTRAGNDDGRGMSIADIIADNVNFANFEETLGITASDAIDGFGGDFFLDNVSCNTRNPYNPDVGESTPPFSIRIVVNLPGGDTVSRFVFSDF